jgi:hypothetical protein
LRGALGQPFLSFVIKNDTIVYPVTCPDSPPDRCPRLQPPPPCLFACLCVCVFVCVLWFLLCRCKGPRPPSGRRRPTLPRVRCIPRVRCMPRVMPLAAMDAQAEGARGGACIHDRLRQAHREGVRAVPRTTLPATYRANQHAAATCRAPPKQRCTTPCRRATRGMPRGHAAGATWLARRAGGCRRTSGRTSRRGTSCGTRPSSTGAPPQAAHDGVRRLSGSAAAKWERG